MMEVLPFQGIQLMPPMIGVLCPGKKGSGQAEKKTGEKELFHTPKLQKNLVTYVKNAHFYPNG